MNGRLFAAAAAVGVLGLMCAGCGQGATSAQAEAKVQASMTAGEAANASGCVKQVDNACMTIKGAGGVLYDVSGAGIDVARGKGVMLTGRDRGETTACGKVLSDVKFDYLSIQCMAPAPVQVAEVK